MTDRLLGALLVVLLAWHTGVKLQTGLLPEMAWACHLATALAAVGLLVGLPTLTVVGGLFHLTCGLPGWILEMALNGTTPSSFALHVATPAASVWAARRHGVPAWAPLATAALWLGSQALGRMFDPALNINLAWHPYQVLAVPVWVSHALNLGLLLTLSTAATTGARRLGWT